MANRKDLKQSVKQITADLLTDCMALKLCQDSNNEELDAIIADIVAMHTNFVARLSHVEKGKEKIFFKKFHEEFSAKVNNLAERIVKA